LIAVPPYTCIEDYRSPRDLQTIPIAASYTCKIYLNSQNNVSGQRSIEMLERLILIQGMSTENLPFVEMNE
jgi:hypothetical protein